MERFSIDFSVIGGDKRQEYLLEGLSYLGYQVRSFALMNSRDEDLLSIKEIIESAACVVTPVPFSRDGKSISAQRNMESPTIDQIKALLRPEQKVAGGCIPADFKTFCREHKIQYLDFMEESEIVQQSTLSTAEGAIAEGITYSKFSIHRSPVLVTGFGKCAVAIAWKLSQLGAQVTVAARSKKARELAQGMGMKAISLVGLEEEIERFPLVFNTVPAMVLQESCIQRMHKDAMIIDIASYPGGVDYAAAKKREIHARLCLGLPGRYAPKAMACSLMKSLLSFCEKDR